MLVLARKLGERIMIGPDIIIQVCYLDRTKVRLGITAPPEINITREEILAKSQGDDNAEDKIEVE